MIQQVKGVTCIRMIRCPPPTRLVSNVQVLCGCCNFRSPVSVLPFTCPPAATHLCFSFHSSVFLLSLTCPLLPLTCPAAATHLSCCHSSGPSSCSHASCTARSELMVVVRNRLCWPTSVVFERFSIHRACKHLQSLGNICPCKSPSAGSWRSGSHSAACSEACTGRCATPAVTFCQHTAHTSCTGCSRKTKSTTCSYSCKGNVNVQLGFVVDQMYVKKVLWFELYGKVHLECVVEENKMARLLHKWVWRSLVCQIKWQGYCMNRCEDDWSSSLQQ